VHPQGPWPWIVEPHTGLSPGVMVVVTSGAGAVLVATTDVMVVEAVTVEATAVTVT